MLCYGYKTCKKNDRVDKLRKTAAKDALKQLQEEGLVLTREVTGEIQVWD